MNRPVEDDSSMAPQVGISTRTHHSSEKRRSWLALPSKKIASLSLKAKNAFVNHLKPELASTSTRTPSKLNANTNTNTTSNKPKPSAAARRRRRQSRKRLEKFVDNVNVLPNETPTVNAAHSHPRRAQNHNRILKNKPVNTTPQKSTKTVNESDNAAPTSKEEKKKKPKTLPDPNSFTSTTFDNSLSSFDLDIWQDDSSQDHNDEVTINTADLENSGPIDLDKIDAFYERACSFLDIVLVEAEPQTPPKASSEPKASSPEIPPITEDPIQEQLELESSLTSLDLDSLVDDDDDDSDSAPDDLEDSGPIDLDQVDEFYEQSCSFLDVVFEEPLPSSEDETHSQEEEEPAEQKQQQEPEDTLTTTTVKKKKPYHRRVNLARRANHRFASNQEILAWQQQKESIENHKIRLEGHRNALRRFRVTSRKLNKPFRRRYKSAEETASPHTIFSIIPEEETADGQVPFQPLQQPPGASTAEVKPNESTTTSGTIKQPLKKAIGLDAYVNALKEVAAAYKTAEFGNDDDDHDHHQHEHIDSDNESIYILENDASEQQDSKLGPASKRLPSTTHGSDSTIGDEVLEDEDAVVCDPIDDEDDEQDLLGSSLSRWLHASSVHRWEQEGEALVMSDLPDGPRRGSF